MIRRRVQSALSCHCRSIVLRTYRTKSTASLTGPQTSSDACSRKEDYGDSQEQSVAQLNDDAGGNDQSRSRRKRNHRDEAVRPSKSSNVPLNVTERVSSQLQHGSPNHTSLTTFLAHAASTGLSTTSTVYKGTHYEYTVVESLRRLNFKLTRVARSGDQGIDLLGHWIVPSLPSPLRVLAQCKARAASTASPEQVRELEGAFVGAPAGWRGDGVIGLLVATGKASKGVLDAVGRSRWPLGFLKISLEGRIEQFVWNNIAEGYGLEGLGVTMRYSEFTSAQQGEGESLPDGVIEEVALIWQGELVKTLTDGRSSDTKTKRGRPRKSLV